MAKTKAQQQKEYRERKKLLSDKLLEKERKRQKKYYTKTSQLIENMNESCNLCDTDGTVSPLIVSINFPERGESSR